MTYETGVITAHPIKQMFFAVQSVWRTWRYAKQNGLPCNKWYGVYEKGSEICVAHVGPLPGALDRANKIVANL